MPALLELVLVRQRRAFLLVLAVALAVATATTFSLPKSYEAEATLFVGQNRSVSTGASAVQLDEVLARTYVSLLRTPEVQRAVVRELPFRTDPATLDSRVGVDVATGTRLIRITATDGDPERARQVADAYAEVFVDQQREASAAQSRDQLQSLRERIGRLAQDVQRLAGSSAPADVSARAVAETELQAARDAYVATQQELALQGSNVSLAGRATAPAAPSRPRPKLYLLLGGVLALALATAAAALLNRFDDRLRGEDELLDIVDAPLLARIPEETAGRESATAEAFDVLAANLRASHVEAEHRLLAVTSPMPGEGKSFTVAGLTRGFARLGTTVLAVDADLRRPTLGKQLGGTPSKGLTNLLVESRRDGQELVHQTGTHNVHLLASGPLPPSPSALLSMGRLREMLGQFRGRYGAVVVDSPPVNVGADTTALAGAVDGVLLVIDLGRSRRRELRAAVTQLQHAEAEVVGIVLNRSRSREHGYGYGYGQSRHAATASNGAGRRSRLPARAGAGRR